MHSKTDSVQSSAEALRYPFEDHPGPDQVVEVMPGVLWARLKLPFRLNHVNIYLLADGDGWAMIDAGFGNEETIEAWTKLFDGPLKGVSITRLIVTHSHPDHVGLAGWIVERFNCPLQMSQVEYLQSVYHQNRGTEERRNAQRLFFRRHGMDESLTEKLLGRGQDYLKRADKPAVSSALLLVNQVCYQKQFLAFRAGPYVHCKGPFSCGSILESSHVQVHCLGGSWRYDKQ